MRLLHTSDWHLGRRLGSQSRLDDQFARIVEIAAYVESQEVDLLLVAGDVFDELGMSGLSTIVQRLAGALRRPLELGVQVVFVAGNHDRGQVFALLQNLKALVAPERSSQVHFVDEPKVMSLQLRTGQAIELVLLPYPTAYRYDLDPSEWSSLEEKHRRLAETVRLHLRNLTGQLVAGVPAVLCGHLLLAGVRGGYCVTEHEEVPIHLPPGFAYVALGHIHRPQIVGEDPNVRYSGSLERMDQGEAFEQKSVVLVDISAGGPVIAHTLPLQARALARVVAGTREELKAKRDELADPDETLVFVRLNLRRDRSLRELLAAAHEFFPRMYGHDVEYVDEDIEPAPTPGFIRSDPRETVRAYLSEILKDDPELDDLLALVSDLLGDEHSRMVPS